MIHEVLAAVPFDDPELCPICQAPGGESCAPWCALVAQVDQLLTLAARFGVGL